MNSAKQIQKRLLEALLLDGEMDDGLYEYELADQADGMRDKYHGISLGNNERHSQVFFQLRT